MDAPAELTVVFRTQSDIEANVVRGLLETRGIRTLLSSAAPHAVFPLSVDSLGEVRLAVRAADAERARQTIDDFRHEATAATLETRLGYAFRDRELLEQALTHRSRAHEDAGEVVADNESLEFLGDAVLGLVIADRLYREFPDYDEGLKSKAKSVLVSAPSLAKLGEALGLGEHLLLGRGEEKSGGRRKPSLLADAFEAVVAAIYLDGGLAAADDFIERHFRRALAELRAGQQVTGLVSDHKSAFQEWLQARGRPLPDYDVAATHGPDHQKVFVVDVRVGDEAVARAEGRSKKEAEQLAAAEALQRLAQGAHGAPRRERRGAMGFPPADAGGSGRSPV